MAAADRTDLAVVHEYLAEGAEDVELGLKVWAQLLVRHLRQGGAPEKAPENES